MSDPFPLISDEQLREHRRRYAVDPDLVSAMLLRVPASWELVAKVEGGAYFRRSILQVGSTLEQHEDNRLWIHVSAVGRRGENRWHLPEWDDLKRVKNDFIGEKRWAYQVFPPPHLYVNHHPYVLHLFALWDDNENALPDFTRGLGTL